MLTAQYDHMMVHEVKGSGTAVRAVLATMLLNFKYDDYFLGHKSLKLLGSCMICFIS